MTWIPTACTRWRKKKKTGQHIVQLFGTESGVRHVVLGMCAEPYVKIAPSMHVQYVH